MSALCYRSATSDYLSFLGEMLYEAFFWQPGAECPPYGQFCKNPEFIKLLDGWGRTGDYAVIAECDGAPTGAAWYRLWTPEVHSYGYVDAATPELGIGVAAKHRSKGVGRRLLSLLIQHAHAEGYPALSLSVDPRNPALSLYQSMGFIKVGECGTSWTMLRLTRL